MTFLASNSVLGTIFSSEKSLFIQLWKKVMFLSLYNHLSHLVNNIVIVNCKYFVSSSSPKLHSATFKSLVFSHPQLKKPIFKKNIKMWNCWLSCWDQLWEEGSYLLSVLTEMNPYLQSLLWSLLMLSTSFKWFRELLSYCFNTVVLICSLSVLHGQMELQLVLLAIIIRKCGVFLLEPILSVKF